MAKFITTTEISFTIERLIREADEFLWWITPFLEVPSRLKGLIENKLNNNKTVMSLVTRKESISHESENWLSGLKIKLSYNSHLHAKCYLNEKEVLLTSMNLYHFSMVNNIEFGVLIDKANDFELYIKIYEECNQLFNLENINIDVTDIVTIATDIDAKAVRIVKSASNVEYLHLLTENENGYLSLRIGERVKLSNGTDEEKVLEMIDKYVVYTGVGIHGRWFTINPPKQS